MANSSPFTSDNPYQEISTIEKKQIRGEDFVEVYEVQNNIEKSSFDFFGLLNAETEKYNLKIHVIQILIIAIQLIFHFLFQLISLR